MIRYEQIEKLFSFNTRKKFCVEIQFALQNSPKYDYCWMGKMWSRDEQKDVFWYGLTPDGKNAFDYHSFEEMANAPVFDGLSLKDVWDHIVIEEIDGCDPQQRLEDYIGDKPNRRMMGAPEYKKH